MVGLPDSFMCFSKVHTYSFAACLVVFGTVPLNYRKGGAISHKCTYAASQCASDVGKVKTARHIEVAHVMKNGKGGGADSWYAAKLTRFRL